LIVDTDVFLVYDNKALYKDGENVISRAEDPYSIVIHKKEIPEIVIVRHVMSNFAHHVGSLVHL
jgi:hypothetical protein